MPSHSEDVNRKGKQERGHRDIRDNFSDTPRLIFKDEAGRTTINDQALYKRQRKEFKPSGNVRMGLQSDEAGFMEKSLN